MPYGKILMETGEELLFEFEGPVVGPVSDEGVPVGLQERFDKVMEMVRQTAQSTYSALENIGTGAGLNEARTYRLFRRLLRDGKVEGRLITIDEHPGLAGAWIEDVRL